MPARLSREAVEILMKAFEMNPKPSLEKRAELATQTGLHRNQVSKWFEHRRERGQPQMFGFTKAQYRGLYEAYQRYGPKPPMGTYDELAEQLGLVFTQVKSWFIRQRNLRAEMVGLQDLSCNSPGEIIQSMLAEETDLNHTDVSSKDAISTCFDISALHQSDAVFIHQNQTWSQPSTQPNPTMMIEMADLMQTPSQMMVMDATMNNPVQFESSFQF